MDDIDSYKSAHNSNNKTQIKPTHLYIRMLNNVFKREEATQSKLSCKQYQVPLQKRFVTRVIF